MSSLKESALLFSRAITSKKDSALCCLSRKYILKAFLPVKKDNLGCFGFECFAKRKFQKRSDSFFPCNIQKAEEELNKYDIFASCFL